MSDARAQLAEVDALIAASPDDTSLLTLREDLLQLIALEEQEAVSSALDARVGTKANQGESMSRKLTVGADACDSTNNEGAVPATPTVTYTAKGTFTSHIASREAIAEAPDLAPFQPVMSAAAMKIAAAAIFSSQQNNDITPSVDDSNKTNNNAENSTNTTNVQNLEEKKEKKKQKKSKSSDDILETKFELPTHLIPLESDTPAQRLKKQRAAKALKSKFREKQKEMEHAKRQNDWKSFAGMAGGKRKSAPVGVGSSIFATEEGVNAKVGVISGGGGGRKLTNVDQGGSKRHKFY
mmetsp:Transcript_468/g.942  ORF Transcript_468/g.942 Transcript_468/m.942 type:complete len:295 (-) Transcript_468:701-1585(-)